MELGFKKKNNPHLTEHFNKCMLSECELIDTENIILLSQYISTANYFCRPSSFRV